MATRRGRNSVVLTSLCPSRLLTILDGSLGKSIADPLGDWCGYTVADLAVAV